MSGFVDIKVAVFGDVQVNRRLERFGSRIKDATPVWDNLHAYFARANTRQFNSQGRSGSGGWKELAASTMLRKQLKGIDPRILHGESGDLRQSLTATTQTGHAIRIAEPLRMVFGSTVAYGPFHQHGTSRMPMRKPMELTETQRRETVKRIQRFIVTGEVMP